jgi:hypothetical protein
LIDRLAGVEPKLDDRGPIVLAKRFAERTVEKDLESVRAQTCAANVPHVTGTWVVLPYQMPINPISASLLHTGKVLIP